MAIKLDGRLIKLFSALAGGRLLGSVAAFISNLLIARYFGADILGNLSFYLAISSIFSIFSAFGLPAVSTLFSARYNAVGANGLLRGFVQFSRKKIAIGSFWVVAIFAIYQMSTGTNGAVLTDFSIENIQLMLAFGMIVIGTSMVQFHGGVLVGLERQSEGVLPDSLLKPMVFLCLVSIATLLKFPMNALYLMTLFAIAVMLPALLTVYRVQKSYFMTISLKSSYKIKQNEIKQWKETAYPWVITSLVMDLFIELHIVIAGFIASPANLAILHIVFRFRMLAGFGVRSLYMLYLPKIIAHDKQNIGIKLRKDLNKMNQIAVAYALVVMLVFYLLGDILLGIFGESFKEGRNLLLIVSISILVRAVFGPAASLLSMRGHQKITALVMLLCLSLSAVIIIMLFSKYGLLVVACAYSGSNSLASLILWWRAKQLIQIDSSIFASFVKLKL